MAGAHAASALFLAMALSLAVALLSGSSAAAAAERPRTEGYSGITPTEADKVITLTGHDLTEDQVVQVARYGAQCSWRLRRARDRPTLRIAAGSGY